MAELAEHNGSLSEELGSSATLLRGVEDLYTHHKKQSEYKSEISVFQQLVPLLVERLKPAFTVIRAFGLGSTATVWEVHDERLNQRRALKLPRPRFGKIDNIIRHIRAEKDTLASLTHHNITKIYLADELKITIDAEEYSFPYFLMDYLDGVKDIDEYIVDNLHHITAEQIITYFHNIANGISFLHDKGVIHCDIKPGNLIIAHNHPALVADLGYAKHFEILEPSDLERFTTAHYTPLYAHPDLIKYTVRSTDPNANVAEIPRSEMRFAFDLYSFGKTLQHILRTIQQKELESQYSTSIFSQYQVKYLALISLRLLDGRVINERNDSLNSDPIPGLPAPVMEELKYSTADQALEDIEKLLNLYDLEGEIPELNPNLSKYIQIPGGRVPLTDRIKRIINHPSFSQLHTRSVN